MKLFVAVLVVLPFLPVQTTQSGPPASSRAPISSYRIVHTYPHDANAFTEGLEYRDGFLYESTGLNGQSSIRKVKVETGDVLQKRALGREYFGEGITFWNGEIFQLTYTTEVGFVYDAATLVSRRTFAYKGEGWALTHDRSGLIMSDGTADLRFIDPATFRERRRVRVTDGGTPVPHLNELEFVQGEIYANIWTTDFVARIDPATGFVTGWIDLRGLLPGPEPDVLNGIAYDALGDRLFVTGKLWPKLFEIRLTPR